MTIYFYIPNDKFGEFSNSANFGIELDGKWWKTIEHYFQAQKFAGTAHESEVRKADRPMEAAKMGRDRSRPLRKDWDSVKDNIMREVVYAKFTQNEDCKKALLSTGDAKLVEHTENDSYWADGGDGSGKNMLGIILMEVRERIRKEEQ